MKLIGIFNLMLSIYQKISQPKTLKDKDNCNWRYLKYYNFFLKKEKKKTLEEFKILNVYEEKGTLRGNCKIKNYVDGSRYEGQILGDKRSGKGIYYYANGDIYLGDW